jgi:TonB family protein
VISFRRVSLSAVIVWPCIVWPLSVHAAPEALPVPACRAPEYPRQSARLSEEGISLLGFLVRTDGTVSGSRILNSSGIPELDQAALVALAKCTFGPATRDGVAIDTWVRVKYEWRASDDHRMLLARRRTVLAANEGNPDAQYQLSLLLTRAEMGESSRRDGLMALRRAADSGQPNAQFELGRRYEKGDGMDADLGEAMRWYEKAAAQGDVLALQRLKLGELFGP